MTSHNRLHLPAVPSLHLVRFLAPAVAAALSACASVAPWVGDLPPTQVPANWSGSAVATASANQAATPLADWWQRFDDPDLTSLVRLALQSNTSLQGAQAALLQARALRDVQTAQLSPAVGASASAQRGRSGLQGANNRFQAGFDASWEPDVFGGNRAAVAAGDADAFAAETSLADLQVSLAAEVALNTINLRGLQARLAIARSNLAAQREILQITQWRTQAGLASSLEVEQAVAASEQTAAQIPLLQTNLDQTIHALAVLTGQPPGAVQAALADQVRQIPQPPPDLALAFPAETLRQRPDVRTAQYRIEAAWARVGVAEAARYPSFRLSGSLGLSALTLGSLTNGAAVLSSVLAGVSAPLLDGGAARARVRAQEAALDQARATYQGAVLTALKDVEDALVAMRGDRERLARLQAAADSAANAELLARQRYTSGLIDFRAVLDTQRTLFSTQDSVASTQTSLVNDHVRLYKALGGGWTPGGAGGDTLKAEPAPQTNAIPQ